MAPALELVETSTPQVKETLAWIREQGFKPVPLYKRSKASLNDKYTDLKYKPPEDNFWSMRDAGVGVVVGPSHSGPVDVDIDCPEAIFFGKIFLPSTGARFGRKSKPNSHYLYRVDTDSLDKRAFIDPLVKSTIIELRADGGHQTVMPGSIHEGTGELIEFEEAKPDATRVETKKLEMSVRKVAIAVMIVRHLWSEGQRNEVCKHLSGVFYYMDWSEEETKDLITAVMDYCGDTDPTRRRTIHATYQKGEKGGKITGANTLRQFVGDPALVDRILEWAGDPTQVFLQDYNEKFAVVDMRGKFRVARTFGLTKNGDTPIFYAKNDFIDLNAHDKMTLIDDVGKPKRVPKARVWLDNSRHRYYSGVDFIPGEEDISPLLNLWTGWGVDVEQPGECSAWMDLLYYYICGKDREQYNWMLNWFANIVKTPTDKSLTCPVLIGTKGAGKSLLIKYFGKILGSTGYVIAAKEDNIVNKFNKPLGTALLLHSEEALFAGNRNHTNIIKDIITGTQMWYEQKGIDAVQINSYVRLVLTSNDIRAAPVEDSDRRFTVIDMKDRKVKGTGLEVQVDNEMNNGGPAALYRYLTREFQYDRNAVMSNLKNDALLDLKLMNMDSVVNWWYQVLSEGQALPDCLSWASRPQGKEWPEIISSSAMYLAFVMSTRQRKSYIPDATYFSLQLIKLMRDKKLEKKQVFYVNPLADGAPSEVRTMSIRQNSIMNLPSLTECRKMFETFMGQGIDWPKEGDKEEIPAHLQY